MEEKKYPVVFNADHYTVMANDVIRGKQDMTLQEARILRLLITQVVKEDKDFKTYSCKITDLAEFLNIGSSNLYRDIKDICKGLLQKTVSVETGNPRQPWEMFQWIQLAKYDGNGTVTLMLSNQIAPYVLGLNAYFTQYKLENILEMKSFYGIRLYELLRSDYYKDENTYQEYSMEFLRQFFGCEEKYKRFNDFKRYVLETAMKEVNEKSDIFIYEVLEIKTGRKITGIKFLVGYNFKTSNLKN